MDEWKTVFDYFYNLEPKIVDLKKLTEIEGKYVVKKSLFVQLVMGVISIEGKISKKTGFGNKSRYDTNKQHPEK